MLVLKHVCELVYKAILLMRGKSDNCCWPAALHSWKSEAKKGGREGMRAASSTNGRARMLGPASHMCHPANQRLGMLGQASHTCGGQPTRGGGVWW